jgi:hypothetical protein
MYENTCTSPIPQEGRGMATIEKRKGARGITYRVRITSKGCILQTQTFPTLTQAKQWAYEMEYGQTIEKPCPQPFSSAPPSPYTLNTLIETLVPDL